ncbi:hypothetical protein DFAR_340047 [Desulfarculales bacterium]
MASAPAEVLSVAPASPLSTPAHTAPAPPAAKTSPESPPPAPTSVAPAPTMAKAAGPEVFWVCRGSFKDEGLAKASKPSLRPMAWRLACGRWT